LAFHSNYGAISYRLLAVAGTERCYYWWFIGPADSQAVTDEFFDELQLVLTSIQSTAHEAVIVGDFNVHVDVSTDSVAQQLNDVLTDNGLSAR